MIKDNPLQDVGMYIYLPAYAWSKEGQRLPTYLGRVGECGVLMQIETHETWNFEIHRVKVHRKYPHPGG